MYIVPKDNIEDDFLFENSEDLFFISRDILDNLEKDLNLEYISTVIGKEKIKEIYKSGNNFLVFKYSSKMVEVPLESYSVHLHCFSLDKKVEVYENFRPVKIYELDITPILRKYIDNEKIFKVAEKIFKDFKNKQSYII